MRDKAYLKWIQGLSCLVCGSSPCDAHHVSRKGHGSMGMKTSDSRVMPLCRLCHGRYHSIGRETFATKHAIDYEYILKRLYKVWEGRDDSSV